MARLLPLVAVALVISLSSVAPAFSQDWPTRPVTMVIPFAAGGPADTVGRILAPGLSEILGQQVIIENVGGSGGMAGASRVAKAPPDGYQFVLGNLGTHAANQTFYKTPLYNAATDFAPVMLIAQTPLVLLARKDLPAESLSEFITYTKANQATMQRLGRSGVREPSCLRAVERGHRCQRYTRSLSRRGAGHAGSHRRTYRLPMPGHADRYSADSEQDGQGNRGPHAQSLAQPARSGDGP